MKAIATLLIIAGFGLAGYFQHETKGLKSQNESLEAQLSASGNAAKDLEKDLAAAKKKLTEAEGRIEALSKPEPVDNAPVQPVARTTNPTPAPVVVDTRDQEEAAERAREEQFRANELRKQKEREAIDTKLARLSELRVAWSQKKRAIETQSMGFKEQSIDVNGNRSGLRTSDADRRAAIEKQQEAIQDCQKQLDVIAAERAKLSAERDAI